MSGERLIILLGLHGFGKSSIARNALHYVSQRKFFTGGILLIQLKNVEKVFSLLKQIQRFIFKVLDIPPSEVAGLTEQTCTEEQLGSFITKFFNNDLGYDYRKQKHQNQKGGRCLICLDNAEGLITKEPTEFQKVLATFHEQCPFLSIIITSHKPLHSIQSMTQPIFK